MRCVNFNVAAMDVDTSKYDDIDKAQIESVKKIKQGQSELAYMNTLGENWDRMQNATILNNLARNAGGRTN